jgi:hypothetical protein
MASDMRGCGWLFVALAVVLGGCSNASSPADDATSMCVVQRPLLAPPCGAAMCGNGKKDGCPDQEATEDCDGSDLAGATCQSLGYAGGVARCDASCRFDLSGCNECGSDPHVAACAGPHLDDGAPAAFAMATSASEIGVAWIANPYTDSHVGFARLKPDLGVISASPCMGSEASTNIALAATTSGWIIAVENDPGMLVDSSIDVIALDGSGAIVSTQTIPSAQTPSLIVRPGDGPLLLFNDSRSQRNTSPTDTVLRGALLNVDGSLAAGPEMILPTVTQGDVPSGVFVGDGFVVAQATTAIQPSYGLQIAKVGLDLSAQPGASISGNLASGARFTWTGSVALMTYTTMYDTGNGQGPGSFWQQVDGNGALVGSRVLLPGLFGFGPAPIADSGAHSLVIEAPVSGGTQAVRVATVDGSGAPVAGDFRVDQGPGPQASVIAFLGTAPVVAWLSTTPAIWLAVLAPSP